MDKSKADAAPDRSPDAAPWRSRLSTPPPIVPQNRVKSAETATIDAPPTITTHANLSSTILLSLSIAVPWSKTNQVAP